MKKQKMKFILVFLLCLEKVQKENNFVKKKIIIISFKFSL
jgi:hypothetical protein